MQLHPNMDDEDDCITEKWVQSWKVPSAQTRTESVLSDQGNEYEYITFPDIRMRRFPQGTATPDKGIGRKPLIIFSVMMLISLVTLTAALVMSCLRCFPECPNNWKKFHEKCYRFSGQRATWYVARHKCQKLGADLVVIDNRQEEEFLTGNMRTHSDKLWIGLHYKEAEQEWKWVDGTTNQSYIFWHLKNPKLNNGQYDLHCTVVKKGADSSWWSNNNCKARCQFACERNRYVVCVFQSPFFPH